MGKIVNDDSGWIVMATRDEATGAQKPYLQWNNNEEEEEEKKRWVAKRKQSERRERSSNKQKLKKNTNKIWRIETDKLYTE